MPTRSWAMLCSHEWELLDKTIMESEAFKLVSAGYTIKESSPEALQSTLVLSFSCKKCGELKIDKTVNP